MRALGWKGCCFMEDFYFLQWLCGQEGLTNQAISRGLLAFGGGRAIYEAGEKQWSDYFTELQCNSLKEAKQKAPSEELVKEQYEKLKEKGILFTCKECSDYPERLRKIPDAPNGLYYRGKLPADEKPAVAIIGARECSEYGSYVAGELGSFLAERGVSIISGMARGIDGISQAAAIAAGGESYGVLGNGVDICYPSDHRRLYQKLLEQGGILSTYPPGTKPLPRYFPPRNRIVSGLSDAIVVIEARHKSGTLITVDMALEQGKDVFVVPGRVTDRLSDGCNRLIAQGAGIFLTPEEFYATFLGVETPGKREMPHEKNRKLQDPVQEAVYQVLDVTPKQIQDIIGDMKGNYEMSEITIALMELGMCGLIRQVTPGAYCRIR